MAIKLQILNLAEPSCSWLQPMQPCWDNTSKRILLKTSAPVSRAIVGVWQISLADCWRLITNWLELIQPGLISLGLFALLHLSKRKKKRHVHYYCAGRSWTKVTNNSEKDELASPIRAPFRVSSSFWEANILKFAEWYDRQCIQTRKMQGCFPSKQDNNSQRTWRCGL